MESDEFNRFIESWGSMGVLWGINRSMARIHAYMILSDEPVDLDKIAKKLNVSRGNASMCLKELRNWGVIQRIHISGDRRDFYVAESDVWKMFFRIAVERKRFNDVTRQYNTAVLVFPSNMLANMFGFKERPYFEAVEGSEIAPVVDLTLG